MATRHYGHAMPLIYYRQNAYAPLSLRCAETAGLTFMKVPMMTRQQNDISQPHAHFGLLIDYRFSIFDTRQ